MRRKEYMVAVLAIGLSLMMIGCADNSNVTSTIEPTTKVVSTESENVDTTDIESTKVEDEIMTEPEEVSTESSPTNGVSESFESYQRYTNTKCNVRAGANKDTELIGSYPINTEVTVTGIDGDWSQISYDGTIAYIKSSLLSDGVTEVKQQSSSSSSSAGNNSNSSTADTNSSGTTSSAGSSTDGSSDLTSLLGAPLVGDTSGSVSSGQDGSSIDQSGLVMH